MSDHYRGIHAEHAALAKHLGIADEVLHGIIAQKARQYIEELEDALKNISSGSTPWIDGYHETSAEIYQEYAKQVLAQQAKTPKFENTYCSQCGSEFGPGDHGYSHCSDHRSTRETE